MIKLWNSSQVDILKQVNPFMGIYQLPEEVISEVEETINILDSHYGDNRHPEKDLGGFLCIQPNGLIVDCQEYYELLAKYGTTSDMAEFKEPIIIHRDSNIEDTEEWYIQLFIISSDYTLTFVFKKKK
ncbi:MAG: hypothetical protein GX915_02370 [Clostridiales bacterium]|nr:hypothetical protein [Clostridiales bacterium]